MPGEVGDLFPGDGSGRKLMDPSELERWIIVHENRDHIFTMRSALEKYFRMRDLHDLSLLSLCRLYADLPAAEREF
ncbi:MAG: hypothetical protein A2133_00795 [Actinobacteria bacterium RBG_16_64_13]|nr:MAG: hypothetical protein A2133_00795 [Actinobacteria bacterium RBG_16_64_13]